VHHFGRPRLSPVLNAAAQTPGRHLLPDEQIHYRNGVKDDNRLSSLELWVRPQPSGIRVEDAIAWAREILDR
jgi:hypothetical protein